jgi:hypothetical protein
MFHGGNLGAVVDRLILGDYVLRDYPFQEIENQELRSSDDERSGCSTVETPEQS